jgi:hypothetical protein
VLGVVNDIRVSARRHLIGRGFDEASAVPGPLVMTNEFECRWKTRKTGDGERTGRRGRRRSEGKARTRRRRRTARDRPCCFALSAAPQGCDRALPSPSSSLCSRSHTRSNCNDDHISEVPSE